MVLSFDLVDLKVGLSTGKNSDTLSDRRLNLLVKLINADVINEILDRILISLASEYSANFDLDEDVVIGRTRLNIQFEHDMLLGD